jgi:hypothetical protein
MPYVTYGGSNASKNAIELAQREMEVNRSGRKTFVDPGTRISASGNNRRATERSVRGFVEGTSAISKGMASASNRSRDLRRQSAVSSMERYNRISRM